MASPLRSHKKTIKDPCYTKHDAKININGVIIISTISICKVIYNELI